MRELARMEAKDDGFVLMNLFGDQEFFRGRIKRIDMLEMGTKSDHAVGEKERS